jgi:hypothetical protein
MVAETFSLDGEGATTLQKIADDLNRLAALERSHAELFKLLERHHKGLMIMPGNYPRSPFEEITLQALSCAQSLISPNKTPTAAPQDQQ